MEAVMRSVIDAGLSLAGLATGIAQNRARWKDAVRFDPDQRYYALLERTPEYEAWLLTWMPGQHTGIHDHGNVAGAFAIVRGTLQESVYRASQVVRTFDRGRVRAFGPTHIHDLTNPGPFPAVSIHVYSPLLTTMTQYAVRDGRLVVTALEQAGTDW
jgi:predicted metal-dependent enzyme (double-stranded beta helix superfamily)